MLLPDPKNSTGMLLEGIFSSEVVDSSGEIVKLEGMDISSFEAGEGVANYEHNDKSHNGKEVVGKIVYVKKIFESEDCETDSQKFFFEKVKNKPYLYGIVRLFDGAGSPEAISLAAQIRDYVANEERILVRFSIEGATIEQAGHIIKQCLARKVALTLTPANKVCNTKVISDPNVPEEFKKFFDNPESRVLGKTEAMDYNPIFGENTLQKAITAGCMDAAPSSLTQGAALQKEDIDRYRPYVLATARDWDDKWDRDNFKAKLKESFHKASLPEVSDSYLDHFANVAEDWKIKKSALADTENISFPILRLQKALIDLRKGVADVVNNTTSPDLPKVYQVSAGGNGSKTPLGRFMVVNDHLHHLEDYHGGLPAMFQEGPLSPESRLRLFQLESSPHFQINEHEVLNTPNGGAPSIGTITSSEPIREPVFEYIRPGLMSPHILEFTDTQATLDGTPLQEDELELMLANVRKGLATIKWCSNTPLSKRDNTEGIFPNDINTKHIHQTLDPAQGKAWGAHIYEDPHIPGIGNKYALKQFTSNKKPGFYASVDVNDSKHLNQTHGHSIASDAIKGVGLALHQASKKVGTTRIFRGAQDKFHLWAPTHDDMSVLLRHVYNHVDQLPMSMGTHKAGVTIGVGHNPESADLALITAKIQRTDPVTKQRLHPPGQTPTTGHSRVTGHEGGIFKNNTVKQPERPRD